MPMSSPGLSPAQSAAAKQALSNEYLAFAGSNLRGMSVDTLTASPYAGDYWSVYSRFRPNSCRAVMKPVAPARGSAYALTGAHWTSLEANLAAAWAIGVKTVVCVEPQSVVATVETNDPTAAAFWASASAKAEFVKFIGSLAQRLCGDKRVAAIDIINEPFNGSTVTQATSDVIHALQESCIAAVRVHDLGRVCIVAPDGYGSPLGFDFWKPSADKNVVYSVHLYQPFGITHSNVGGQPLYTGGWPSTGVVGGGAAWLNDQAANRDRIKQELQNVINFQRQHGVTMYVGEFSCSRMTPHAVAPAYIADCISIFEELGWSWNYHAFGFCPVPWDPFEMPFSAIDVTYNNGSTSGVVALNLTTATPGNNARTPIAPVAHGMTKNNLHPGAPLPAKVAFLAAEDFEIAATGRSWTSLNYTDGAGVIDTAATSFPKSGTKHMLCTHADTGDSANSVLLMSEVTGANGPGETFLSFDIRLGASIAASKTLGILETYGAGGGQFIQVYNVPGTNTWQIDIWKGSGDYGARQIYLITGMTLPVGNYTRLKFAWLADQNRGRVRAWQDNVLLVDINTAPTVTNNAADTLWRPNIGLKNSNQRLQTLAFDNILFSRVADAA